jgi:hypothetical protein
MSRAGFETTIPVLERSKKVRGLDFAAIGTSKFRYEITKVRRVQIRSLKTFFAVMFPDMQVMSLQLGS